MRKFIIFSPSYDVKNGGAVCLHKLVDMLNRQGMEAYLMPFFSTYMINSSNFIHSNLKLLRDSINILKGYKTNKEFITPVIQKGRLDFSSDDYIVLYPEIVAGNPLNARNVVRWLLHQPGFHTGFVSFGHNEYIIRFNQAIKSFVYPYSCQADFFMPVIHYPLELYNLDNVSEVRVGSAYCIRKGRGRDMIHDVSRSILIDKLPHNEVAKIFKRVETFISYDAYTAYSRFAALCGCDSVVVPTPGVSISDWYPSEDDRLGVAYGFENLEHSRQSRDKLLSKILNEVKCQELSVEEFVLKANKYFDNVVRYKIK